MGTVLLAQGAELDEVGSYESRFAEGQSGELWVFLAQPLTSAQMAEIESQIRAEGVVLTGELKQDGGVLLVQFQKAIAPLVIVALAVAAGVAGAGGIFGWQLFKKGSEAWDVLKVSGVLIAGGVVLWLLTR